ncbi:histidine kinase [uncultured Cellulomonas sp.]|uniref:sensor histidine kinase n=1 Tax=uncultured Cellulomonas sp. TaxID=189682 RepID=UPI0028EE9B17|nr:histidine kinase [uncultured Cellulomonas sp.]
MPTTGTVEPYVLTEAQVRRRGPVGRLVTARPWIAGAARTVLLLLLGTVTVTLAAWTVQACISLGLYAPDTPASSTVPLVWIAGTVLGALLLTCRRRWPLGVTAALTVLALGSLVTAGVLGTTGVCLAFALFTVAATRPARTAWTALAVVFVVVSVALWQWQDIGLAEILLWSNLPPMDGGPYFQLTEPEFSAGRRSASVSLLLALLLLGVAAGSAARARWLHAHDLVQRYEAIARDRDQSAALARAAERARIAREMHDVVAHSVSVMVALSDGAGAAFDRAPDRSREAMRELSRTGREALSDMQRVLGALDPGEDQATEMDLAAVVERFRTAGVPVTATGLDDPLPRDTALRLAVLRIVTEALTNVLRHAVGTASAEVAVRRSASAVEVEVLDAGGTRPTTSEGTGRGLVGMRERAALLGGHVDAGPRPGGGWRVRVVLPWSDDDGDPR